MSSPTQRSLRKLREDGWLVAVVERFNHYAKVRCDLFGFADLLAVRGHETLAVQTTTGSNLANRLAKIGLSKPASIWLESPTRKIAVHGWVKAGPRGKRKLWRCREVFATQASRIRRCNKCGLPLNEHEAKAWLNTSAGFCEDCSMST